MGTFTNAAVVAFEEQLIAERDATYGAEFLDQTYLPSAALTKEPELADMDRYFRVIKDMPKGAFALPSNNYALMGQLGRAYAQKNYWGVVDGFGEDYGPRCFPRPTCLTQGSTLIGGEIMTQHLTDYTICAAITKNANGTIVPEAYVFNSEDQEWSLHNITNTVREDSFHYNRQNKTFCYAFTKYHLMAMMLCGEMIYMVGERPNINATIHAFQRETYSKVCGFNFAKVAEFEKLIRASRKASA